MDFKPFPNLVAFKATVPWRDPLLGQPAQARKPLYFECLSVHSAGAGVPENYKQSLGLQPLPRTMASRGESQQFLAFKWTRNVQQDAPLDPKIELVKIIAEERSRDK